MAKKREGGGQIAFKGLSSQLSRRIYEKSETIAAMVEAYPRSNGRVGNLPKEIIAAMKKAENAATDLSRRIEVFIDGLTSTAKSLKRVDRAHFKALGELDFKAIYEDAASKVENPQEFMDYLNKFNVVRNHLSAAIIEKNEKRAAGILTRAAKKAGVLPRGGHAEIRFMDNGFFGCIYQVSFVDKCRNKIYSDKVIKVYKDMNLSQAFNIKIQKGVIRHQKTMTMEHLTASIEVGLKKQIPPSAADEKEVYELAKMSARDIKSTKMKDAAEFIRKSFARYSDSHGQIPEANRAVFLKRALGDMRETNVVTPYIFDTKSGYGLAEMANDSMPAVKRKLNAEKLGIFLGDAEFNPANQVAGRIIDFGGILKD